MNTLLVTGTDTGVGKTWITSLLVRQLQLHGRRVGAYKPVCSGAEVDDQGNTVWSDVEALRTACAGLPPIDHVCPQRFQAAVAPNVAAALEGRTVDDEKLFHGTDVWRSMVDWLVVEGAGGIFCPLSDRSTVMELALHLQGPIIVVAANRLGVISHTRMTVEILKARGLEVTAIVLNEIAASKGLAIDPSIMTNALQLQHWIPEVPLFHCDFQAAKLSAIRSPHDNLISLLEANC